MKKTCFITFLLISLLVIVSAAQAATYDVSNTYDGTLQYPAAGTAYADYYCSTQIEKIDVSAAVKCSTIGMTNVAESQQYFYAEAADADNKVDFTANNILNIDISRRQLTITPDSGQSKIEGQTDPVLTYTYTGEVSGETPALSGILSRETGEDVDTYKIEQGSLDLSDTDPNYYIAFITNITFSITTNNEKPTANSLTYTGSEQDLLTTPTPGNPGDWYYRITGSGATESKTIPQGTDAGSYSIDCWFIASDPANNYWSTSDPLVVTVSIAQADITATDVTAPAAVSPLTYNGSAQTLISAGSCNYGTMLYKTGAATGDISDYSADLPAATNADSYVISYAVQGDSNHNNYFASDTVSVTIDPKALADSMISFNPIRFDNDGSSHTAVFTVTDPVCGTLTENTDWETDASSVLSASDTGIYTVKVNGLGNYYTGTASAKWVIDTTRIEANTYTIQAGKPLTFRLKTNLTNPVITWTISDETIAQFIPSSITEAEESSDEAAAEANPEAEDIFEETANTDAVYTDDEIYAVEDALNNEDMIIFTNESKDGEEQVFYADAEGDTEGVVFYTENSYDALGSTSTTGNPITVSGLQGGTITLSANVNGIYDISKTIVFTAATQPASTAPNEIKFYLLNDPFRR